MGVVGRFRMDFFGVPFDALAVTERRGGVDDTMLCVLLVFDQTTRGLVGVRMHSLLRWDVPGGVGRVMTMETRCAERRKQRKAK